MRVKVLDGAGENLVGFGNYEEDVKTYCFVMPDGSLHSLLNAEEEPHPSQYPSGGQLKVIGQNPKIVLDSGKVVYGCQVWWEPVSETVAVPAEEEPDPWANTYKSN